MRRQLLAALRVLLALTVITGVVYPLVITGVARIAFPDQAGGSLVSEPPGGDVVGSALQAQRFTGDEYFHPRPSAADYDGSATSGSNYGPANPEFLELVEQRVVEYRERNGLAADVPVPVDAVTASGSGLDPEISAANAELQAARVAQARGRDLDEVLDVVRTHTSGRALGFLGEPRVNVLLVNLSLDSDA